MLPFERLVTCVVVCVPLCVCACERLLQVELDCWLEDASVVKRMKDNNFIASIPGLFSFLFITALILLAAFSAAAAAAAASAAAFTFSTSLCAY